MPDPQAFQILRRMMAGIIRAMPARLQRDSFSLNMRVLAAVTARIAPTLYVGYAMYALIDESDRRRRSDER